MDKCPIPKKFGFFFRHLRPTLSNTNMPGEGKHTNWIQNPDVKKVFYGLDKSIVGLT